MESLTLVQYASPDSIIHQNMLKCPYRVTKHLQFCDKNKFVYIQNTIYLGFSFVYKAFQMDGLE